MAGIFSQGGSAGHRYAGWLSEVEAKNFQFGGKVFNGSPSAIYVGSKMVWPSGWLTFAAVKAILGAFGQRDGMAVIKATNAYLNQLAASDRDKATALAGFINEDPMMVCSLGLEVEGVTMPDRWLVNDGASYINLGKSPTRTMVFKARILVNSSNLAFFGVRDSGNTNRTMIGLDPTDGLMFDIQSGRVSKKKANGAYNVELNVPNAKGKIDSEEFSVSTMSTPSSKNIYVMAINNNGSVAYWNSADGSMSWLEITDTNLAIKLVPYKHKIGDTTVNGMLDLEAVGIEGAQTWYPNAGTGSFTIPDISYTPSTP